METEIKSSSFFKTIDQKADRSLELLLLFYFIFGIFLGFFYETWLVAFGVGALNLILYYGIKFLLPQSKAYQYVGSLVVGVFMAQFIYQMHGLFEMHFTAFIAIIILMAYQNLKIFIPVVLFIVVHHSIFAYIQYIGFTEGVASYQSIYFTQMDYMDFQTFLFHAGLVVVAALIAGNHSIEARKNSLRLFNKIVETEKDFENTQKNIEFAREIANDNYEVDYQLDENDPLGTALVNMQKNLKTSSLREKREKFLNLGLSKLSDIIRNNNSNLSLLMNETLTFIIKYMKLNQGGIFIVNDDDKNDIFLELEARYAYGRKKQANLKIHAGEGLVGQCYLEKDVIYLTEIPDSYIRIRSGLGDANPRTIVIVPIQRDGQMEGVMELASFSALEEYKIDFLKEACESIAVALNTTKVNDRTKMLYEESQRQAEEMRTQEEEMRHNMEEMEATQEELARKNKEIEKQSAESKSLLTGLQSLMAVIEFTPEGRILEANKNFLQAMGYDLQSVQGKHHKIFVSPEYEQTEEYQNFWKEIGNGEAKKGTFERYSSKGKLVKLNAIYTPIADNSGVVQKVIKLATVLEQ
ncbi:hypothetical protein C9994_02445 [Marivirga lumbricoides]|uniref:GAF domain-containing protein n=1 Tax=Marivirga lumbricoides TaxID=1046115 RepID=A0A2T4DUS6_9BACT|nr:hypothetical protein C9994_02445 [Marivirga lumbricoides]